MLELELPTNLLAAQAGVGARHGLSCWLRQLPEAVAEAGRRWSLAFGRPFQPGGTTSWVAPARTPDGGGVVVKVAWRHDEALHEAAGLRAWDGRGAVHVLDAAVVGESAVLLLEMCDPGTPLGASLPPGEQDVVIAALLRRLWSGPYEARPFRSLASMCERWAAEFERRWAVAPGALAGLDPGLVRLGLWLFRDLPTTSSGSSLLVTDLHPGNVLAARREPWLVIDPKPYIGDATYDPLQHMLNFPDRLAADPGGFADGMADLLDLDHRRLRLWLFARCVVESIGQPHLQQVAADLAP